MRCSLLTLALATMTLVCSGCSSFRFPSLIPGMGGAKESSVYGGAVAGEALRGSESAQAFERVAQAKSQNAVVLHVPGDDDAVRLLPLPSDGQSVFVSDLLRQSGVLRKFKRVRAVLYRASDQSINGIRMAITMAPDAKTVRPEADYALRAGDRLEVTEAPPAPLNGMLTTLLGL